MAISKMNQMMRVSAIVWMALCCLLAASSAWGEALKDAGTLDVSIGQGSGQGGDDVRVPVSLTTQGTQPAAVAFRIQYDWHALTYKSVGAGATAATAQKVVAGTAVELGAVSFVVYGVNRNALEDGELLTAVFEVTFPSDEGFQPLVGWTISASDPDGNRIGAAIHDGQIAIHASGEGEGEGEGEQTGSLAVVIKPAEAVTAGAQWRVDGGAWRDSGMRVDLLAAGAHTVDFKAITSTATGGCFSPAATWVTPGTQSVTVAANETTTLTVTYQTASKGAAAATAGGAGAAGDGFVLIGVAAALFSRRRARRLSS